MKHLSLSLVATAVALVMSIESKSVNADVLYADDTNAREIKRIDASGSISTFAGIAGGVYLRLPSGIAFDREGNLYVANNETNVIIKVLPDGTGSPFAFRGLSSPTGLAFDSAGNLFVANANRTIQRFSPDGSGSLFSVSVVAPTGLAFDRAGNLYASNASNAIERITPGGVSSIFASSGLNNPFGLAFDRAGNLYAANYGDNTIEMFNPDGAGSVFASSGLDHPYGLAFDSVGNLYVSNMFGAIERFSPSGDGFFFAGLGFLSQPASLAFTTDDGVSVLSVAVVPEPPVWAMVALGCAAFSALRRRQARSGFRRGAAR